MATRSGIEWELFGKRIRFISRFSSQHHTIKMTQVSGDKLTLGTVQKSLSQNGSESKAIDSSKAIKKRKQMKSNRLEQQLSPKLHLTKQVTIQQD
jgi:hypothetical protein